MLDQPRRTPLPGVYVTDLDYERLANLARTGQGLGARLLSQEIERAVVVEAGELPRRFVRLGSRVDYRDFDSGEVRTVEVVTPEAADIDAGRLSVLSPVGAALIGLCEGAAFALTTDDGRERVLVVQSVAERAEAA